LRSTTQPTGRIRLVKMAEIVEGVHPTRMELLEMNKRIALAKKGHKLLKEKRDSLVMEFLKVVDKGRDCRKMLIADMSTGYGNLIKAEALSSSAQTESIASIMPEFGSINLQFSNVMGIKIPKIELKEESRKAEYNPIFTSSKLDEAIHDFNKIIKQILNLVETEERIRLLGNEIKKTKRRVNALEYTIIPRLENTQRYITMRLEEMERENFFRLKTVKRKKEKRG